MRKLLAIYNTCGISGSENIVYYVDAIRSLLYQNIADSDDFKIVLSACAPSTMWQIQSTNTFHDAISYNFIGGNYPLSVTFNHTVDKMVEKFGEFSGYLYIDSGISFWDPRARYDAVQALYAKHTSGPYAITAAMPSNDDGRQWWGIEYRPGEDFIFPVGKTTNMHCQIFDNSWRRAYGKVLPDIFASHCMESIFSHMCGAIQKKMILTQDVHLLHAHSLDGASIGSRAPSDDRIPMSDRFETGGLLYKTKRKIDGMYERGVDIGFGIEQCKEWWQHRPECFDENGYAKSPLLKDFFASEVYLRPDEFDYNAISSQFIPGR